MRILTVCTHNRTRSVIAGTLLLAHLRELGIDADVRSAGVRAEGLPPTEPTVRFLRGRGFDVSEKRSTPVSEQLVSGADLILTAEGSHVVWIAGRWPSAFRRSFTLPELVGLSEQVGPRAGRLLREWLDSIDAVRPDRLEYLDDHTIPEVADPPGGVRAAWSSSFAEIDELTVRVAKALAS